jgi:hypothetical protein
MKNALLISAIALASVVAPQVAAQEKWSANPGAVTRLGPEWHLDGRARVRGTFEFVSDPANGIESNGFGGACLVADLTPQGIGKQRCSTDLDCNPVVSVRQRPGRPDVPSVTHYSSAYCLKSHELPSAPKICWVRPGSQDDYCSIRRPPAEPLSRGKYPLPTVRADPTGKDLPVRWRIVTCLNPPNPSPMPTDYKQPCSVIGSTNKQSKAGPIRP